MSKALCDEPVKTPPKQQRMSGTQGDFQGSRPPSPVKSPGDDNAPRDAGGVILPERPHAMEPTC